MRAVDVFIHSSPHSGSTWLGYVLGSGRETAFVGELYRAWDEADRVPCTFCASLGRPECTILGGIEHTDPADAFAFIAARNGRRIIVENSKKIEWTRQFLDRADRDTKVVHLFKDPRSRWASLRRREAADMDRCLAEWCDENQQISEFIAATGVSSRVVAYDLIAADPSAEFRKLFRFLGTGYAPGALRYWQVEHHGFAANGASSALIRHRNFSSPPGHFATGDDAFYSKNFGRSFVDRRWQTELPADELDAVASNHRVLATLDGLGYALTQSGLRRLDQAESGTGKRRSRGWLDWLPGRRARQ